MQVGLLSADRHIIIANLDAQAIDLNPYQYSGAKISVFTMMNRESELMKSVLDNYLNQSDWLFQTEEPDPQCPGDDSEGYLPFSFANCILAR